MSFLIPLSEKPTCSSPCCGGEPKNIITTNAGLSVFFCDSCFKEFLIVLEKTAKKQNKILRKEGSV